MEVRFIDLFVNSFSIPDDLVGQQIYIFEHAKRAMVRKHVRTSRHQWVTKFMSGLPLA